MKQRKTRGWRKPPSFLLPLLPFIEPLLPHEAIEKRHILQGLTWIITPITLITPFLG